MHSCQRVLHSRCYWSPDGVKMGKKPKGKGGTSSPAAGEGLPTHLLSAMPPPKLAYQQPETLLPNCIWVLPNFFSRQECTAWIHFMEQQQPLDYVHQRGTRYLAARECYRFSQQDATMSHRIFERLRDGTKLLPALPSARELCSGEAAVVANNSLVPSRAIPICASTSTVWDIPLGNTLTSPTWWRITE